MRKMFYVLLVFMLFTPSTLYAGDYFVQRAKPKWKTSFKINRHTNVVSKYRLNKFDIRLMKLVYNQFRRKFYTYMHVDKSLCKNSKLDIRVVSEKDLDNRFYFSGESTFARKGNIIFGRYFPRSKVLYIVPPYEEDYFWRANMVHELLHHFYSDCGIKFENVNIEHIHIDKFIKAHSRYFY
jgi:hypothetical protein